MTVYFDHWTAAARHCSDPDTENRLLSGRLPNIDGWYCRILVIDSNWWERPSILTVARAIFMIYNIKLVLSWMSGISVNVFANTLANILNSVTCRFMGRKFCCTSPQSRGVGDDDDINNNVGSGGSHNDGWWKTNNNISNNNKNNNVINCPVWTPILRDDSRLIPNKMHGNSCDRHYWWNKHTYNIIKTIYTEGVRFSEEIHPYKCMGTEHLSIPCHA